MLVFATQSPREVEGVKQEQFKFKVGWLVLCRGQRNWKIGLNLQGVTFCMAHKFQPYH